MAKNEQDETLYFRKQHSINCNSSLEIFSTVNYKNALKLQTLQIIPSIRFINLGKINDVSWRCRPVFTRCWGGIVLIAGAFGVGAETVAGRSADCLAFEEDDVHVRVQRVPHLFDVARN